MMKHAHRAGSEITAVAPDVIAEISTGRESTRLNPRHNIRPVRVDWAGYEDTVEALRRTQWQVTGIARTLVDAADDRARQPAPSPNFLARYADALDALADVVAHFGLHEDDARATFDNQVGQVNEILAELRELVRVTPMEDPEAWPVYGSLISDAQRAVRELDSARSRAVLPTDDSGSIRSDSTPGEVRSLLSTLGHRSHTNRSGDEC